MFVWSGVNSMMTGHDNVCVASNTVIINRLWQEMSLMFVW